MRPDRATEECLDRVPFVLSATCLSSPPPLHHKLPLDALSVWSTILEAILIPRTFSNSRLLASCYLFMANSSFGRSSEKQICDLRTHLYLWLRYGEQRCHTLDSEWTDLNLQDRDKGAARIHLAETIEELKKFNARRRLKDAVKAAVSSSKWHAPYSEANGDNFSDVGDDETTTGASNSACAEFNPAGMQVWRNMMLITLPSVLI
jgi:hypothetical protein